MTRRPLLIPAFLSLTAYVWVFFPVLAGWVRDLQSDSNYTHGIPMILVLLALGVWRSWKGAASEAEPAWSRWWVWGSLGFVLSAAGFLSANDSLARWGAIAAALALLEILGSPRQRWAWRAPILALVTLVPWPYVIYYAFTSRLQSFSSVAAAWLLQASGVPLARDGNLLQFDGYRLEVVEACSGLRSLLAMSALAALIAVVSRVSARRALMLLLLAVPLALVANLLRLVVTGYAAQLGGPQSADGLFHAAEGILTFGLGAIVLSLAAFPRRKGAGGK